MLPFMYELADIILKVLENSNVARLKVRRQASGDDYELDVAKAAMLLD